MSSGITFTARDHLQNMTTQIQHAVSTYFYHDFLFLLPIDRCCSNLLLKFPNPISNGMPSCHANGKSIEKYRIFMLVGVFIIFSSTFPDKPTLYHTINHQFSPMTHVRVRKMYVNVSQIHQQKMVLRTIGMINFLHVSAVKIISLCNINSATAIKQTLKVCRWLESKQNLQSYCNYSNCHIPGVRVSIVYMVIS